MNKRMKKKYELMNKLSQLEGMLDYAICEMIRQARVIEQMERVNSRNAQVINERFEQLESANKVLRVDLDKGILSFKKGQKKSLFSRR